MRRKQSRSSDSRANDPMAVKWGEEYNEIMDKIWSKIPEFIRPGIVFLAVFSFGTSLKGDWISIWAHFRKQINYEYALNNNFTSNSNLEVNYMTGFFGMWLYSVISSFTIYYGVGGFIQWYFYIRQKSNSKDWKCQPDKWLSPEIERHEILLGSFSLFLTSSVTAFVTSFICNGGWSMVYYKFDEYSWLWWFLQWIVIFIQQDYSIYIYHRLFHTPYLYKKFHKLHHLYKQPTAFSVTAIHPVEVLGMQALMYAPLFTFPVHWIPLYGCILYNYFHGILGHSGVNFKSYWWQPWQPDTIFHDNHHQYTHINFGFNMSLWDKLHGTCGDKDTICRENGFWVKEK